MSDVSQPSPPASLTRMQDGFGRSIATPFEFLDEDNTWRLRTEEFPEHVVALMRRRGELSGSTRLGVYNQQYWFRLFTTMQEEYPLLRHLLGVLDFNRLVSAYLDRHPSRSPSLRWLSVHLREFLGGEHRWNRPVLRECAALEYAYIHAFDAAAEPPLDPRALSEAGREELAMRPLGLQPHLTLYDEHWNLVELRAQAKDDKDDELQLTPEERRGFWAIHRADGRIPAERLGPLQYQLLGALVGGASLGPFLRHAVVSTIFR